MNCIHYIYNEKFFKIDDDKINTLYLEHFEKLKYNLDTRVMTMLEMKQILLFPHTFILFFEDGRLLQKLSVQREG